MGIYITALLLSSFFIHAVAGLAGPPAARPPDFETLQKSFSEDERAEMRRVVITKPTTVALDEPTAPTAATEGPGTKTAVTTTERSEFADDKFSGEMEKDEVKESSLPATRSTSEPTTEAVATTPSPEQSTEATTEPTSRAPRRLEIKKIERSTSLPPPPEDQLSPVEELRLLKKLAKQGIAFGVKNKELELIHNSEGELELPPFAFSEDENTVAEEKDSPVRVEPTTPSSTMTEAPTTKETTTEAPTTKRAASTTPSAADIELLEKELARYKEEPFKVGTNVVPQHLFFDKNTMGIQQRRKLTTTRKLEALTKLEKSTTTTVLQEATTTRVPAVLQPFVTPQTPRTDDFLVPRAEEMAEDEKKLDLFVFPTSTASSGLRTTMKTLGKNKRPEKMVLPTLLEMPNFTSLSSFGSLAVPIHPSGLSQPIRSVRLDSDAQLLTAPAKNRTSGRMQRRRLFRRKTLRAAAGTPTQPLDGVAVPLEAQLVKKLRPPRIVIKQHKEKKVIVERRIAPLPTSTPAPQVSGSAKIIRTDNVAVQEQLFAQSLTKSVVDSLKKMKKATRLYLNRNRQARARARAAGKTVVRVEEEPKVHAHEGGTTAKAVVKIDGNTDGKVFVVDRDPSRKTVDRDA